LLVVIAIIALLLAIIMPALNTAKQIAATAVCLSNQRQLGLAFILAAEYMNGDLVDAQPTDDGYVQLVSGGKKYPSFVASPTNNTTLEGKIEGFKKGGLWSYLETHKIFNCPFDDRWRKSKGGNSVGGYRSYSMGSVLSRAPWTGAGEQDYTIKKYSQFSRPSDKFVFLEENDASGTFNDNHWAIFVYKRKWWDPFAVVHNGSSTFSYADGHAGKFKWTDEGMIEMSQGIGRIKQRTADTASRDYELIKAAYIPGRL
jgi:prepilin-type processing-associated H-X9-DG protein